MAEEKVPEQIPWAEVVKVIDQSDSSIGLKRKTVTSADIWHRDFEWSISFNSKIAIDSYMKLDERLTRDIQDHFDAIEAKHDGPTTFRDRIMSWLRHGLVSKALPREGPKEWRPPSKGREKRQNPWKLHEQYGYGNTTNEDNSYYWGDVFEYAHFETDEGDEGAVIIWHGGGDPRGNYEMPQVYLGNFEEFMDSQYEGDPYGVDTFLSWNGTFENGFMWAWEKMGIFDDPDEHIVDLEDKHVKQVLAAIEQDPSILLPESVEKILLKFDEFPIQIQKAVRWLAKNQRREIEKALGQHLLWGDLYGE